MTEDIWETEWRYSGIPAIGDYVQILGISLRSGVCEIREGMIGSMEDSIYGQMSDFTGQKYKGQGPFTVEKWRKAILPEVPPVKITQQRMMK